MSIYLLSFIHLTNERSFICSLNLDIILQKTMGPDKEVSLFILAVSSIGCGWWRLLNYLLSVQQPFKKHRSWLSKKSISRIDFKIYFSYFWSEQRPRLKWTLHARATTARYLPRVATRPGAFYIMMLDMYLQLAIYYWYVIIQKLVNYVYL